VAELHASKLEGKEEPKLSIAKMTAIAFINFHTTLKTQKRELVLAEFIALRAKRSDNDWVTGGEVFIEAQRVKAAAKVSAKKDKQQKQRLSTGNNGGPGYVLPTGGTAPHDAGEPRSKRPRIGEGCAAPSEGSTAP
jgi:hypothetical protein